MKSGYLLGALYNATFMLGAAIFYQLALRELVLFEWARFFGEPWFFAIESLILPVLFLRQGNRELCVGALFGIVIYFLSLPLAFIHGD